MARIDRSRIHDRHGLPAFHNLAETADFNALIPAGERRLLAANESTYKFKPSVALKRHQSLNDLDVQDDDVALADASEQLPAKEADPAENAVAVAVN